MQVQQPATQADWTIGRLLSWTTDYLRKNGIDEPRLATEVLLAHAAGCRRIELYTRFEGRLTDEQTSRFREWVRRAAAQEPIAYLVGQREFFSLPFTVTPDVLIPRPETESLVERAVDHCTQAGLQAPKILDVGTGSGCIVVSLLTQMRQAVAVGSQVSEAALAVARTNAARHGVADRVTFVQADRLAIPAECIPGGVALTPVNKRDALTPPASRRAGLSQGERGNAPTPPASRQTGLSQGESREALTPSLSLRERGFDLLVCNPPYIPAGGVGGLAACIRDFEPHSALTDGADGLSFYRSVAAEAPRLLAASGVVIMEVGDGQAGDAIATMLASGAWTHVATLKDRVVGKERVIVLRVTPRTTGRTTG